MLSRLYRGLGAIRLHRHQNCSTLLSSLRSSLLNRNDSQLYALLNDDASFNALFCEIVSDSTIMGKSKRVEWMAHPPCTTYTDTLEAACRLKLVNRIVELLAPSLESPAPAAAIGVSRLVTYSQSEPDPILRQDIIAHFAGHWIAYFIPRFAREKHLHLLFTAMVHQEGDACLPTFIPALLRRIGESSQASSKDDEDALSIGLSETVLAGYDFMLIHKLPAVQFIKDIVRDGTLAPHAFNSNQYFCSISKTLLHHGSSLRAVDVLPLNFLVSGTSQAAVCLRDVFYRVLISRGHIEVLLEIEERRRKMRWPLASYTYIRVLYELEAKSRIADMKVLMGDWIRNCDRYAHIPTPNMSAFDSMIRTMHANHRAVREEDLFEVLSMMVKSHLELNEDFVLKLFALFKSLKSAHAALWMLHYTSIMTISDLNTMYRHLL